MKKLFHWIKEHPLILALIAGVIVLFIILRGSSNGSAVQAANAGPSDTAIAANTQLQLAQIASSTQEYQTNAQLAASQNDTAASLALAQIQANTQQYITAQNASVNLSGIQAQENVQMAGIQGQTQLAQISAHTNEQQIAANVAIAQSQSATYQAITNAQAETQQHAIDAQAAIALAPYQYEASVAHDIYSTLGSGGLQDVLNNATRIKDAIVNLPGLSAMRATNFVPPGGSAQAPSGIGAAISGAVQGLGSLGAMLFA